MQRRYLNGDISVKHVKHVAAMLQAKGRQQHGYRAKYFDLVTISDELL
jgi:hypothetical protein